MNLFTPRARSSIAHHSSAAALLAAVLCMTAAAQEASYDLIDLGTLGGHNSRALAVNEQGDVVGASELAPRGRTRRTSVIETHAFLWRNGVTTDLGTLGGAWSEARDINESRQIVGISETPAGDYRAFYSYDGIMFDLNALLPMSPPGDPYDPGFQGDDALPAIFAPLRILVEANAISDDGSIVAAGYVAGDPHLHAFLVVPNDPFDPAEPGFTAVNLGGLPAAQSTVPLDLNDQRQVVGLSDAQPFIWEDGGMDLLEQHATTVVLEGQANAINAAGVAAGFSGGGGITGPRACIWWNGQRFDLSTMPGVVSEAHDINDAWQVAGWEVKWDALPVAMLWEAADVGIDLDQATSISDDARSIFAWSRLMEATGINNSRWISGWGVSVDGRQRAFLLVPLRGKGPSELPAD